MIGVLKGQIISSIISLPGVELHDVLLCLSELLRHVAQLLLEGGWLHALGRVLLRQREDLLLDLLQFLPNTYKTVHLGFNCTIFKGIRKENVKEMSWLKKKFLDNIILLHKRFN